jgi:hypothetical protein
VPSGAWFPGDPTPVFDPAHPLPALPTVTSPPGAPELEPLASPELQRFCRGDDGEVRICASGENNCAPGQVPDPDGPGCLVFGGGEPCPPGFVATLPAPGSASPLPGCAPDPADCGAPPYGNVTPQPGMVFVDANATVPGKGTWGEPFTDLVKGLTSVHPVSGTLVLASGTYTVPTLSFNAAVTVRGRCAAMVTLTGPGAQFFGVGPVAGAGDKPFLLRGVRLQGDRTGVIALPGAKVRLERVLLDGLQGTAAEAQAGSQYTLVDSVIRGTREGSNGFGVAVMAADGADARFDRVRLVDNRGLGVVVQTGAKATAERLVVSGTVPAAHQSAIGIGVAAIGTVVDLRGATLADNTGHALKAIGATSSVQARGLLVSGTRTPPAPWRAAGVVAVQGAHVRLDGARIHGNRDYGVHVSDSQLTARGIVVDATLPLDADAEWAIGVGGIGPSQLDLRSLRLHANRAAGFHCEQGAKADVSEALIDGMLPIAPGKVGQGVMLAHGANARFERVRVQGSQGFAVTAVDASTLIARWLVIDGTVGIPGTKEPGFAIVAADESAVGVSGGRIHGGRGVAVAASIKNAAVGLTGVAIEAIQPSLDDGWSVGVLAQVQGAVATVGLRTDGASVGAQQPGSQMLLWGAAIMGQSTAGRRLGWGVHVIEGGALDFVGGVVRGATGTGAYAKESKLTLRDAVVAGTVLGPVGRFDNGKAVEWGDGSVGVAPTQLTVDRVAVSRNARAGLLLTGGGSSKVTATIVTGNSLGVALKGLAELSGNANAVWDNPGGNLLTDKGLPLPDVAPRIELPQLPVP